MNGNPFVKALRGALEYLRFSRRSGHTTTMIRGASGRNCYIVTANSNVSRVIDQEIPDNRYTRYLTLHELADETRFQGWSRPSLAWDNSALEELFSGTEEYISYLENEVEMLNITLSSELVATANLQDRVKELNDEVARLLDEREKIASYLGECIIDSVIEGRA